MWRARIHVASRLLTQIAGVRATTNAAAAVSPASGIPPAARGRKHILSRSYEIHSGRRVVKTVLSSSPLQAAIDYVHTFGSAKEITILGPDTVSWRGARFVGVLVPNRNSEAVPPVSPLPPLSPGLTG